MRLTDLSLRIVGKGIHSVNHVQKIKPKVEQICQELGLQYATEENAGRIYINLTGSPAQIPQHYQQNTGAYPQHHGQQHHGQHQSHQPSQQQYQQGPYSGQQQQGQQQQQYGGQQQDTNAEIEQLAEKLLPKLLKKLDGCCIVM